MSTPRGEAALDRSGRANATYPREFGPWCRQSRNRSPRLNLPGFQAPRATIPRSRRSRSFWFRPQVASRLQPPTERCATAPVAFAASGSNGKKRDDGREKCKFRLLKCKGIADGSATGVRHGSRRAKDRITAADNPIAAAAIAASVPPQSVRSPRRFRLHQRHEDNSAG